MESTEHHGKLDLKFEMHVYVKEMLGSFPIAIGEDVAPTPVAEICLDRNELQNKNWMKKKLKLST